MTTEGALDEARFSALAEQHRHELQVHSYRMLGNLEQAEDAVQEALLKAWRGRATFDGGPGARAWLYRIVTTTCLDALRAAKRRPVTSSSFAELPWLQPYPDVLLDAAEDPERTAIRRETIELAYLAVIQLLPARQRAVLLLRDVEGYSAAETGRILQVSSAAVDSALQRARASIASRIESRDSDWSPDSVTDADRALLAAFIDAHVRQDPVAALAIVREDVRTTMPPQPALYLGREALRGLMEHAFNRAVFGEWLLVPTSANRMPAAVSYLRQGHEFVASKIDVLRIGQGQIAEFTTFGPSLLDRFGLPATLPAER